MLPFGPVQPSNSGAADDTGTRCDGASANSTSASMSAVLGVEGVVAVLEAHLTPMLEMRLRFVAALAELDGATAEAGEAAG